MKKEAAVIQPLKVNENKFRQSRFEGVPSLPARYLMTAASFSGKSTVIGNLITRFYVDSKGRTLFRKCIVFSRSCRVDPMWQEIVKWITEHCDGFEEGEEFAFETIRLDVLEKLFAERKRTVNEERRAKEKYISQVCVIIDDMSDAYEMQARRPGDGTGPGRENPISRLYFGGRHWGITTIASVHGLASLNSMSRRSSSAILIWKINQGTEREFVIDSYSALVGRETFTEILDMATREKHSFLTIQPGKPVDDVLFMIRFEFKVNVSPEADLPENATGEPGGT